MNERPQRVDLDPVDYDEQWARLAARGADVHGEATLVETLLGERRPEHLTGRAPHVLDAGCGTGRVALRLAGRGFTTTGVDTDPRLLARAREKAPTLEWVEADLAQLTPHQLAGPYDAVVMAGNVEIFLAAGTVPIVLANLAARLAPGGLLISGFQLRTGGVTVADHDAWAVATGLSAVARYATWQRDAFVPGGDYVVTVDSSELRQSESSKR